MVMRSGQQSISRCNEKLACFCYCGTLVDLYRKFIRWTERLSALELNY
ncbi:MAG: hypothetical protein IGNPGNKH_00710 [Sodalis sp. Ffu]|nr:MAG: hypothetical protein IGNPGNKH_00710 [Sodalis sp. Ffu]